MVRTIPEYKRIAEYIAGSFGCSWQDLGTLCHNFTDSEYVEALAGNLPPDISERLQAYEVKCTHPEGIPGKAPKGSEGEKIQEKPGTVKSTEKKKGKPKKEKTGNPLHTFHGMDQGGSDAEKPGADDLERVTDADIMPAGFAGAGLPDDFADKLENWFADFSKRYELELVKASQQQWHSACMYVGERVKKSGALRDDERIKKQGGSNIYSGKALVEFVSLWEYFTGLYKHIPMTGDFIALAGMSRESFFDSDGRGLTSSQVDLRKKVLAIVEAGIAGGLVDGRENPTGKIFYSKARLGWQESPQVLQISPASVPVGGALPVFNSAVGALEDKKP